jgi:hypothetical protein
MNGVVWGDVLGYYNRLVVLAVRRLVISRILNYQNAQHPWQKEA